MGVRLYSKGLSSNGLLVWLHSNISTVDVDGEGVSSGVGLAHRMSLWLIRFLSLMVVVGVVVKVDEFGGEGVGTCAGADHTDLGVLSKLRLVLLSSLLLLNTVFFVNSHVGTASCNLLCFLGVMF